MVLYRNKYLIPSIRLQRWDYRSPGWYFITLCTRNRSTQPFGYIRNGYMCLSDIGTVAHQYWLDIPNHFANVSLDTFIIMPDHIHGIIRILNIPIGSDTRSGFETQSVETCHGMSLRNDSISHTGSIPTFRRYNTFGKPVKQSIPMIINQYKSVVTRWCNQHNQSFQWQPRYYEKIIRSERELLNVRQYIRNNPINWKA